MSADQNVSKEPKGVGGAPWHPKGANQVPDPKPHSLPDAWIDNQAWVTMAHYEELLAERDRLEEQLESLRDAAERLRYYFDQAEMRWMSVEDSFIDVPSRAVAEIGRALGSNPASRFLP